MSVLAAIPWRFFPFLLALALLGIAVLAQRRGWLASMATPTSAKTADNGNRWGWAILAGLCFAALMVGSILAPDFVSPINREEAYLMPWDQLPFGTNEDGKPLWEFAAQGAKIVTIPSIIGACLVMILSTIAGLMRCAGVGWTDTLLQGFSEIVGALPRFVVILVVAVAMPAEYRSLVPIAIAWAVLSAPGAMDEAASTAGRLGGERFVEALRAHGLSAFRIYFYHVIWLNLRAVIVRQGGEILMQIVFLEISLSYLAQAKRLPALTHSDSTYSWAVLLYDGFKALVTTDWKRIGEAAGFSDLRIILHEVLVTPTGGGLPLYHSLVLALTLIFFIAVLALSLRFAARAR